jgi:ABC-type sulfate transport system permease component
MYRLLVAYSAVALALLLAPFAALLYYGYGPYFSAGAAFGADLLRSMALTFTASASAVLADFALFTPLAFILARTRSPLVEALADVPASVPHPLVGIALAVLASPQTAVGRALRALGLSIFDSYLGLITALAIVSAPVYIRSAQSFFEALPKAPEQFALSLGAGELKVFWLTLRSSWRQLLSSGLTAMSRAISEFGSVVIIAYYIAGGPFAYVSPASVYIWKLFETYYLSALPATATLFLFSLGLLAAARLLGRR